MKIYEVDRTGPRPITTEAPGRVHRARVAGVFRGAAVLKTPEDIAPFTLGCVVTVRRQGRTLPGYITPTEIARDACTLRFGPVEVMVGDVLEVAVRA